MMSRSHTKWDLAREENLLNMENRAWRFQFDYLAGCVQRAPFRGNISQNSSKDFADMVLALLFDLRLS